jgi:hypothetical protein
MDRVDCTPISGALARKLPSSGTTGRLLQQMPQVASTGVLARLTITYHDARERKYASIYDYQNVIGWMTVKNAENIEHDLHELDAMHPMTQQSNVFYWRLGKSHL